MNKTTNSNIIDFKQDHKHYYRRAKKLIDDGEIVRGIKMLYMAIDSDESNTEYRLTLCQELTDIGYYKDSIDELQNVFLLERHIKPECFFILGCNYYELGYYVKALNMFERYMQEEDENNYSDLVYYYLESIDSLMEQAIEDDGMFPRHIYSVKSDITNIASTKLSDDIEAWSNEQNIKALMAYSKDEYEESIKICEKVLAKIPNDYSVKCTLALSQYKNNQQEEGIELIKEVAENMDADSPDMFRACYVLCIMDMDDEVVETLLKIKAIYPYSEKINHYLAIAYYNIGSYQLAEKLWYMMNEITRSNYIYKWYLDNVLSVANSEFKRLEYTEQIPGEVIIKKMALVEQMVRDNGAVDEKLWQYEEFRDIILWGIEESNTEMQLKFLHIIMNCAGESRERILRKLLLKDYVTESGKNEILAYLNRLGAVEPYLMMTDYQLVDVAVNVVAVDDEQKRVFVDVISEALEMAGDSEELRQAISNIWSELVVKYIVKNKKINNITLWAAALTCAAQEEIGHAVYKGGVADKYDLSYSSLITTISRIREDKENIEDEDY